MLSINDTSAKSTNKVVKDIDKKSNLHSNMIEGHSNLKRRYSAKSKNKEVTKLHSDIINKDFDENVQKVSIVVEILILVGFLPKFLQLCQLFHQNLC